MRKEDFLAGITAQPVDFETDFGTIKMKGLTVQEVKQLESLAKDDSYKATLLTIVFGMVEPKLEIEDVKVLGDSSLKSLYSIAKRISELSGMEDEKEDSPN